jgi:hypothetical protein
MARYQKKKDFGLGKATQKEKATARKMANMAQGKPPSSGGKKLSSAMYTWAKTNMSKLKSPTKAQKKIFDQYKAMKAAGDNPTNPKPKAKAAAKPAKPPAPPKPSKPAARKSKLGAAVLEMGGSNVKKSAQKSKPAAKKPEAKKVKGSRRRYSGGTRTQTNVGQALTNFAKSVDKTLKLTHKKGDTKKVGNKTYRWNGKKWQLLNRPF